MVDIIDNIASFDRLKSVWSQIQDTPGVRIFQTYEWCRNAWDVIIRQHENQSLQPKLWVLKWCQEGRDDVVLLPLYVTPNGCLRYIFDTHSDVCDAVYRHDCTNRHWAYKEFADAILQNKNIRSVWLQKQGGDSEAIRYLSIFLQGSVVYKDNAYSWVRLEKSDSIASSLTHFKRKDRDRIKGILKKAAKLEFSILSFRNGDEFPEGTISMMRDYMTQSLGRDMRYLDDRLIAFMRTLYVSGICELPIIRDESGCLAIAFRLLKDDRINCWVVLYKDNQLTSELYARYMEAKSKNDSIVIDFGVGVYGYKLGTFRPVTEPTYSLCYGKTIKSKVLGLIRANLRFVKDIVLSITH